MLLILRKSYLTENLSYWILIFISKLVEYVSLMTLGHQLTVFQRDFCETVVTKIYAFLKIRKSSLFYLSFLIMHVGGIHFINHKTKDYLPEGAGLLNLSMSTLKE